MDCGGKRSATPLSDAPASSKAVSPLRSATAVQNVAGKFWRVGPATPTIMNLRIFALLLTASLSLTGWAAEPLHTLRWATNAGPGGWALHVAGLDAKNVAALRGANWTAAQWQKLLVVHVHAGDALGTIGLPAMLGTYGVTGNTLEFTPQFPLEPGLRYVASFHPASLPVDAGGKFLITSFVPPRRVASARTVVAQIYPTARVLPENLLKFYVHFSAPMNRGHIYDYIHLRDASGKAVELPFLEIDEELWNPAMTRLTLFIDPGRIKRGVTPLEEIGPALEQGKSYALEIDRAWTDATGLPLKESFRKTFAVGPTDREALTTASWKITAPKADTREPLIVNFPKPLDHALALRMIQVAGASTQLLDGHAALDDEERRWTFTPAQPWPRGPHALLVPKTIEDLAGNNIGKAFEVDLFEAVERRFTNATVRLPFEVR